MIFKELKEKRSSSHHTVSAKKTLKNIKKFVGGFRLITSGFSLFARSPGI
jgi:hypothetical protein